ncbi:hypothetical protein PoB_000043700 [Plakobranchus ocellatus]|uniref:Uncharacterized protein n=1 Tax=Plakobranchus ocellatus TaxID=259542 RepID=A0AAV3XUX6_9GAST|nr:hypothetical protein PoB_000043700 [Plakobranchus ocellatus]
MTRSVKLTDQRDELTDWSRAAVAYASLTRDVKALPLCVCVCVCVFVSHILEQNVNLTRSFDRRGHAWHQVPSRRYSYGYRKLRRRSVNIVLDNVLLKYSPTLDGV